MILELNNFDTLVAMIIIGSSLIGLYKGVTKSVLWLIFLFCSIYTIINYRITFANQLTPYVSHEWLRIAIASICMVFVFMALGTLLSKILQTIMKKIGLGAVDHIGGLFFGFARGAIIAALILKLILLNNYLTKSLQIKQSKSWPKLKILVDQQTTFK